MPKGIPVSGKRAPWGSKSRNGVLLNANAAYVERVTHIVHHEPEVVETDEEISARINERFEILQTLTDACATGDARALIVSGAPGLGKSFQVEASLTDLDPERLNHVLVKGYVRATGLFKLLWQYRMKGQVIVFDDADSIFNDETSLNLLKGVCDTTLVRRVNWLSEAKLIDEESAELIPKSFEFEGTIIFISNYDFDEMIRRGHKLTPHLEALMSRAHYVSCGLKTKRDYIIRIKQVVEQGMLHDLTQVQKNDVIRFIEANQDRLRELSLRMAVKLGNLRLCYGASWEKVARITACK